MFSLRSYTGNKKSLSLLKLFHPHTWWVFFVNPKCNLRISLYLVKLGQPLCISLPPSPCTGPHTSCRVMDTQIWKITDYKSHRYFKSKQTRGSGTQYSSNICNTHADLLLFISFDPTSWMPICNTIPVPLLSQGGQTQILSGIIPWHLTCTSKMYISDVVLQHKSPAMCFWTMFGFGFYLVYPHDITKKHPGMDVILFVKSSFSI